MPNYCYNKLKIIGEPADLIKFYHENKTDEYELSFTCSQPDEDWGTKWDAMEVDYTNNTDYIVYRFETAWNHPYNWLETVAEKYKNLIFKLTAYEDMCDFYVKQVYENGKLIRDEHDDYSVRMYRKNNGDDICDQVIEIMAKNPDLIAEILDPETDLNDIDAISEIIEELTMYVNDTYIKKQITRRYYLQKKYFYRWIKYICSNH